MVYQVVLETETSGWKAEGVEGTAPQEWTKTQLKLTWSI